MTSRLILVLFIKMVEESIPLKEFNIVPNIHAIFRILKRIPQIDIQMLKVEQLISTLEDKCKYGFYVITTFKTSRTSYN